MELRHWLLVVCVIGYMVHLTQGAMTHEQVKKAMKTFRNMCQPKSGVSKEALEKLTAGEFVDDKKLKCYIACAFNMMQIVKNNKVSLGMIKTQASKMLEPELAKKIVTAFEACENSTGEDSCELSYNMAKCVYAHDKDAFLVPGA